MGIVELPVNNAWTRMTPTYINIVKTMTRPPEGSFQFSFDEAAKGNLGLVGFGGPLRNLDGIILSMVRG